MQWRQNEVMCKNVLHTCYKDVLKLALKQKEKCRGIEISNSHWIL